MINDVNELRGEVAAAIELIEQCQYTRAADWFREMDRVLAAPDVDGSHVATARLLGMSAAGMGHPLETVNPTPESGLSQKEANRRRDQPVESMWNISMRMAAEAAS